MYTYLYLIFTLYLIVKAVPASGFDSRLSVVAEERSSTSDVSTPKLTRKRSKRKHIKVPYSSTSSSEGEQEGSSKRSPLNHNRRIIETDESEGHVRSPPFEYEDMILPPIRFQEEPDKGSHKEIHTKSTQSTESESDFHEYLLPPSLAMPEDHASRMNKNNIVSPLRRPMTEKLQTSDQNKQHPVSESTQQQSSTSHQQPSTSHQQSSTSHQPSNVGQSSSSRHIRTPAMIYHDYYNSPQYQIDVQENRKRQEHQAASNIPDNIHRQDFQTPVPQQYTTQPLFSQSRDTVHPQRLQTVTDAQNPNIGMHPQRYQGSNPHSVSSQSHQAPNYIPYHSHMQPQRYNAPTNNHYYAPPQRYQSPSNQQQSAGGRMPINNAKPPYLYQATTSVRVNMMPPLRHQSSESSMVTPL